MRVSPGVRWYLIFFLRSDQIIDVSGRRVGIDCCRGRKREGLFLAVGVTCQSVILRPLPRTRFLC
jgi:hypothetical protein